MSKHEDEEQYIASRVAITSKLFEIMRRYSRAGKTNVHPEQVVKELIKSTSITREEAVATVAKSMPYVVEQPPLTISEQIAMWKQETSDIIKQKKKP